MRNLPFRSLLPLLICLLPMTLPAADLQIFAAASLTDALNEIAPAYEKATGDKLSFNFAGSSLLERQIEQGAPADLFLSADEAKMDAAAQKGLIVAASRKSVLSNFLVVVVPADSPFNITSPADLATPAVNHLAVAQPETVPAGVYAKKYLQNLGLWDKLQPKIVPTENVRAALAAVEAGNAEAGIVYETDAAISKKVRVACNIPAPAYEGPIDQGPQISYPFAIVQASAQPEAAARFLSYLESPAALAVFKKYGFVIE